MPNLAEISGLIPVSRPRGCSDCRSARPATSRRAAEPVLSGGMHASGQADNGWAAPLAPAPLCRASVRLPGSKSITNRALILAALADTPTLIVGPLRARDTELMAAAIGALGAAVERRRHRSVRQPGRCTPGWRAPARPRSMSGMPEPCCRFVPPAAALATADVEFTGDPARPQRPVGQLLAGLRQAGVDDQRRRPGCRSLHRARPWPGPRRHRHPRRVIVVAAGVRADAGGAAVSSAACEIIHRGERIPSAPHIAMTVGHADQRRRGRRARLEPGAARPGTAAGWRPTSGGSGRDASRPARSRSSLTCRMRPRSSPRPWSPADGDHAWLARHEPAAGGPDPGRVCARWARAATLTPAGHADRGHRPDPGHHAPTCATSASWRRC